MIIAATGEYFFINTTTENFHLPRCFHFVVKFIFFSVTTLSLSHFVLFF